MDLVFAILAASVTVSVAFLIASEQRRARRRVWREAARVAGLTEVRESEGLFVPSSLEGPAGKLGLGA